MILTVIAYLFLVSINLILAIIGVPFVLLGFVVGLNGAVSELPFGADQRLTDILITVKSVSYYVPPLAIIMKYSLYMVYTLSFLYAYKAMTRFISWIRG